MTQTIPEDQFQVILNKPIGLLSRRMDYTQFNFNDDYLDDPSRLVLGLRFEENLHDKYAANIRLPPWFSNLLPEGRLREWIARDIGVSVAREMELLARVGNDLPGAVKVNRVNNLVAQNFSQETNHGSQYERGETISIWKFSLAGVGLKFSMLKQGERFTAPALGEDGDWIVKLPDSDHQNVPLNELAMMKLAGASGIEIPDVMLVHRDQLSDLPDQVWPKGEDMAYAIRRFDRTENRNTIHIEDMAQVCDLYPEYKYSGSFNKIAALLFRTRDIEALEEFTRRLVFNVLIGNGDAHLKNWSIIYRNPRIPTLSPAYDIISTILYRPQGDSTENLGLKLNRSRRFEDVRLSSFTVIEERLGAKTDLANVARDLINNVQNELSLAEELLKDCDDLRDEIINRIRIEAKRLIRS